MGKDKSEEQKTTDVEKEKFVDHYAVLGVSKELVDQDQFGNVIPNAYNAKSKEILGLSREVGLDKINEAKAKIKQDLENIDLLKNELKNTELNLQEKQKKQEKIYEILGISNTDQKLPDKLSMEDDKIKDLSVKLEKLKELDNARDTLSDEKERTKYNEQYIEKNRSPLSKNVDLVKKDFGKRVDQISSEVKDVAPKIKDKGQEAASGIMGVIGDHKGALIAGGIALLLLAGPFGAPLLLAGVVAVGAGFGGHMLLDKDNLKKKEQHKEMQSATKNQAKSEIEIEGPSQERSRNRGTSASTELNDSLKKAATEAAAGIGDSGKNVESVGQASSPDAVSITPPIRPRSQTR